MHPGGDQGVAPTPSAKHQRIADHAAVRMALDQLAPSEPRSGGNLAVDEALGLLDTLAPAPSLLQAAFASLNRPELQPFFAAKLAAMSTQAVGRLVAILHDAEQPATRLASQALAQRRLQASLGLRPEQTQFRQVLARPESRALTLTPPLPSTDGLGAEARADAFIAAGRQFIGQELLGHVETLRELARMRRDTTPSSDALEQRIKEVSASCVALAEAKREELLVSVGISEELATAMVATLELDGADPVARARLFEELVPAVRLSGGVAMFRLVHATAGAPVSRDVFLGASALFVLPIDGRRVHHELGHALDAARDDVHAAALALRDRRVLAKTSFTMNDLNVVHELSRLAGPRAQARLLERMIALGEIPPLVDGDSLRRVFEGLDVDVAIAALEERDFSTLRVYEEWETALPVLGEPYVGKEYPDNSEVMSLGFQELGSAEHLTQGLVADDELVCFAVGALLTKA